MQAIISGFISAGNISQQFFHTLNSFFRSSNPDLLSLSKYPRVESVAQRNGDDDFRVSLIVVRDHDIAAKSVDNQIHVVIDEDQRDAFNLSTMHGEGVIGVVADVRDGFEVCLGNQCFFCITL